MNKEYKPVNNTFREHWKLHNYLSPSMIEELMDKVDDLEAKVNLLSTTGYGFNPQAEYWRMRYEYVR
jgi:enoyl-CoA hydratase/carnithine racemase